jgi:hypothetical protein
MASFGRKGLHNDALAAQRASFVAAERARSTNLQIQSPGKADTSPNQQPIRVIKVNEKSLLVAYALWFFASPISAHRFYLGAWQTACFQAGGWISGWLIIMLNSTGKPYGDAMFGVLTMIGVSLWILADVFLIPGLKHKQEQRQSQAHIAYAFS